MYIIKKLQKSKMKIENTVVLFILLFSVKIVFSQEEKIHQQIKNNFVNTDRQLVFVWLNDYVDVETFSRNSSKNRGQATVELLSLLKEKSDNSQSILKNKIARELGNTNITWTYVTNGFYINADWETINKIALWSEVKGIYPEKKAMINFSKTETSPPPSSAQPGLKAINAHKMWELGYTGYGRKAYVFDSGEDYNHPALKSRFHGNSKGFKNSWSGGSDRPFDVGGHGTHVTGTICGLDVLNKDTIGVAFNATWMGGPIQFRNSPTQPHYVKTFIENFQYALNPDGDVTTIDDMPDVINNSWGDTITFDCNIQDPFTEVFKAFELVGIANVWSAGNDGPNPSTVAYYHGLNYSLVSGFSVGATNHYFPYQIADFSSRGPSDCIVNDPLSSQSIKPEVSAPGVAIRSSVLNGEYDNYNGTSMAAPHVSGAVLLLKEAFPYLSGEDILYALYYSAVDLGSPEEDNVYGKGLIDVYGAYLYLVDAGNTPVPPLSGNKDISILDLIEFNTNPYCKDYHKFSTVIFNNGLDTISEFLLKVTSNNNGIIHVDTINWSGELSSGDTTIINLPAQKYNIGGTSFLKLDIVLLDGEESRIINNTWLREFEIFDRTYPEVIVDVPQKICVGSNILLTANINETDNFIPAWFQDLESNKPLGEGNNFLYGPFTKNTSVFVEPLLKKELNISYDETLHSTTTLKNTGLTFDVKKESYFESVTVFIAKEGLHVFNLVNDKSKIIKSVNGNFKLGKQTLKFDALMQPGLNYKIVMAVVKEAGINNQNITFPMDIDDVITINKSIGFTEEENSTTFAIFFDWKISLAYPCGRQEYKIIVNEADSINAIELLVPDSINIAFDNNFLIKASILDTSYKYYWSLTDNPNSNDPSFIGVFDTLGLYNCSLMILDSSGCSNVVSKNIFVYDNSTSSTGTPIFNTKYEIIPNPSTNYFTIYSNNNAEMVSLSIFDISGKIVKQIAQYNIGERINIFDLVNGTYFLKIRDSKSSQVSKIMKI